MHIRHASYTQLCWDRDLTQTSSSPAQWGTRDLLLARSVPNCNYQKLSDGRDLILSWDRGRRLAALPRHEHFLRTSINSLSFPHQFKNYSTHDTSTRMHYFRSATWGTPGIVILIIKEIELIINFIYCEVLVYDRVGPVPPKKPLLLP